MDPIDMLLFCPVCHNQHIDEPSGEWTNPPHKSHLCAYCGTIWRPADVETNGVADIETCGQEDTWDISDNARWRCDCGSWAESESHCHECGSDAWPGEARDASMRRG